MQVPVGIDENGDAGDDADTDRREPIPLEEDAAEKPTFKVGQDRLHTSREVITKYGTTEGCPACAQIDKRGHMPGRFGYNHYGICRTRVTNAMRHDPEYRDLMQRHGQGEEQELEILTEVQWEERQGHARKVIQFIEEKMRRGHYHRLCNQFGRTMTRMMLAHMGVAEFYSFASVTTMAKAMALNAGWSFDLITQDTGGRAWGFNNAEMRNRTARRVLEYKFLLFIGSPMCTVCSSMNACNHARMDGHVVKARFVNARKHLEFSVEVYRLQWQVGRYFLHGHPESASPWQGRYIQNLRKEVGVAKVVGRPV